MDLPEDEKKNNKKVDELEKMKKEFAQIKNELGCIVEKISSREENIKKKKPQTKSNSVKSTKKNSVRAKSQNKKKQEEEVIIAMSLITAVNY